MRSPIVLCLIIAAAAVGIHAFPEGAPAGACKMMKPKHMNSTVSDGSGLYNIVAASEAEGSTVTVTLGGDVMKGFLIVARAPGSMDGANLGQFQPKDDKSQTLTCTSTADAITHTKNDPKTSVVFQWTPAGYSGDVMFLGTIAKSFDTYYMGIQSNQITVKSARRRRRR